VKGVFDIWYGAPNYWAGIVKGGYVTEMSPFEIPDNGPGSDQFAFMNKIYEAHGVHYLGHMTGEPDTGNHFLYTQKSISKIEDLKGMKIRVPPLTRFFITAIGAEPVTLPPGDIYLALERGTVDGFTWPYFDGFTNFGWQEVSKFLVAHPLYRDGTAVIINLAKWKSLPDDAKQILNKAAADTQQWARGWVSAHQAGQLAKMKAAGMKVVELSPAEAKRWEDTSRACSRPNDGRTTTCPTRSKAAARRVSSARTSGIVSSQGTPSSRSDVFGGRAMHIFDRVLDIGAFVSAALLICTMLATTVKVLFRYGLRISLIGVDQISGTLLLYIGMFGAAWVLRREEHVIVDLLLGHVSERTRTLLLVGSSLLGALVCLTVAVNSDSR
jgi:hypothetical protein